MGDKKRKGAATAQLPPQKKSKRAEKSTAEFTSSTPIEPMSSSAKNDTAVKSKTNRKRAADFLDEDDAADQQTGDVAASLKSSSKKISADTSDASSKSKGSRKAQRGGRTSLTADGVNGVVEHGSEAELETATDIVPVQKSLMAEGLRTVDSGLHSDGEYDDDDEADHGAVLLAGFDSDTEDVAEDTGLDLTKTGSIPNYKKTSKKLRNAVQKGGDGPGTVYVGRVPHGFYEKQMREYFGQFGDITKLRLSRNRRTGASKHFAFIEFASDEVAKIVAETMDNYLMFGHILKCKYAPAEHLHPDVWKGANKKYRKIPHEKLERQQLEAPKTAAQWEKKNRKEQQKRNKNAAKLAELGYSIPLPTLKSPSEALALRQERTAAINDKDVLNGKVAEHAAGGSADANDVSHSSKKKKRKTKVDIQSVNPLTEVNLGAQNAAQYVAASEVKQQKSTETSGAAATKLTVPNVESEETGDEARATKKGRRGKKLAQEGSISTDKGVFDSLSSVPIGVDAAGDETAQAWDRTDTAIGTGGTIETSPGVADAVLKERKQGRKKDRKRSRSKSG